MSWSIDGVGLGGLDGSGFKLPGGGGCTGGVLGQSTFYDCTP